MVKNSEIGISIKQLFHEWDCCRINEDQFLRSLSQLGFTATRPLMNALDHHKLTRNLSFTDFMKVLMQEDITACSDTNRAPEHTKSTSRLYNAMIFKDIPVLSSAKAPYGTDNNLYTRDRTGQDEIDPLSAAIIDSASNQLRRSLGVVPGAKNVFDESDGPNGATMKPRNASHMTSTANPITGNGYVDEPDARPQLKERPSVNVITGEGFEREPKNSIVLSSKKHFDDRSTYRMSEWSASERNYDNPSSRPIGLMSDIISHNPDRVPLPHRPIMKAGSAKRPEICPFATDADDLDDMRRRILMNPLGKLTAPEPVSGPGTLQ